MKPPELTDEECARLWESAWETKKKTNGWVIAILARAAYALAWERRGKVDAALCVSMTPAAHWDARDMRVADMIAKAIERGEEE